MKLDKKVLVSVLNGRELTREAEAEAGELAEQVVRVVATLALDTKTQATLSDSHIVDALTAMGVNSAELANHVLHHKHRGYTHKPTW